MVFCYLTPPYVMVYDSVMSKGKLNSVQSGVAGEYLTAGELSRRGYIASITLRNTKGIDILVSSEDASHSACLQVKTSYGKSTRWVLNFKAENYYADNLFYCFVNLNNGKTPDFFIVPSKIVADTIRNYYKEWLNTPGRKGQKHKENPMRTFKDAEKKYLNRWDLLGL